MSKMRLTIVFCIVIIFLICLFIASSRFNPVCTILGGRYNACPNFPCPTGALCPAVCAPSRCDFFKNFPAPSPRETNNECRQDSECKLIYSSCNCQATLSVDPRTSYKEEIDCIQNSCAATKTKANCVLGKCVVTGSEIQF